MFEDYIDDLATETISICNEVIAEGEVIEKVKAFSILPLGLFAITVIYITEILGSN